MHVAFFASTSCIFSLFAPALHAPRLGGNFIQIQFPEALLACAQSWKMLHKISPRAPGNQTNNANSIFDLCLSRIVLDCNIFGCVLA